MTVGSVALTPFDALIAGGSIRTTKAFSVSGALEVFAAPTVRLGLYGSYGKFDGFGAANDLDSYSVFGQAAWLPVSGFQIGAEVATSASRRVALSRPLSLARTRPSGSAASASSATSNL